MKSALPTYLLLAALLLPAFTLFSQVSDTALYSKAVQLAQSSLTDADQRDLNTALAKAQEALSIFEAQQRWQEVSEALGLVARYHFQMGQFDEAATFHSRAKEVADAYLPPNDDWSLNWYFLAGTMAHERQEYGQAISFFEKTLSLMGDTSLQLVPDMGNADAAAQQQARIDFYNFGIGATQNYMAFSYRSLGDFDKSLDAFFTSLAAFKKCPPLVEGTRTKLQVVNEYGNIASTYLILNRPDEAEQYYQQALQALEGETDSLTLGTILFSASNVWSQRGDFNTALSVVESVQGLFERGRMEGIAALTGWNEKETYVSVIARKAWLAARAGRSSLAETSLQQALSLIPTVEMNPILGGMVMYDLAETNLLLERPEAALYGFQKGLALLNEGLSPDDVSKNPKPALCNSKILALRLLEGKTSCLYRLGQLDIALDAAENAVAVLDQMRGDIAFGTADGYSIENTLLELEGLYTAIFSQNIQIALDLYQQTHKRTYLQRILDASEKSKTYALRQAVRRVGEFSGLPADLREQQSRLLTRINLAEKMLSKAFAEKGPGRQVSIEKHKENLIDARTGYRRFVKKLKQDPSTARYFNFQVNETMPTLKTVRSALLDEDSTGIVEFYESGTHLQAIVIGEGVFEVVSKKKPDDWERLVNSFQQDANDLNLNVLPEVAQDFAKKGYRLFGLLLEEPLMLLGNGVNRLVIVPHGSVSLVDMELLSRSDSVPPFIPLEGLDDGLLDCSAFDYVVKDYAVSYLPSLAILAHELKNRPRRPVSRDLTFLGVAPGYAGTRKEDSRKGGPWEELPDEVSPLAEGVFKNYKKLVVAGEQASEARYRELAGKYAPSITHISAHGDLNDSLPLYSRLLFADYGAEGPSGLDGQLEVAELYNMHLETDLAVLSACNTGAGIFARPGEGRISLTRGFAYAGCPSILMGLWKLDAQASGQVLEPFYKNLLAGLPIDRALQQAKLGYLENIRRQLEGASARSPEDLEKLYAALHPYFWGGLVPFGRMDPLAVTP